MNSTAVPCNLTVDIALVLDGSGSLTKTGYSNVLSWAKVRCETRRPPARTRTRRGWV